MAPELRTILRYIDDHLGTGDYDSAISKAIQSIKVYDDEREYENSISVLEKLISIAELRKDTTSTLKYVDNLKTRALLSRNKKKYQEICKMYDNLPTTPLGSLLEGGMVGKEKEIILENLDIQTIFGDFENVPDIPYIYFNSSDDAIRTIEEYYEPGRYLVNLLNISTSLHQAFNLDVGDPEEFNVVDRSHTFRIS
ncbi:MAG: hypothetical protein ACXAE3_01765 [Candidatus Kariarchaeaceae archaeon]|jgi:hypothetical protein